MDKIGSIIVTNAKKYIGQTEKPQNSGFNDAEFEKRMKDIGFVSGHAWCAYFSELVWRESYRDYNPKMDELLNILFSGSVVKTFNNFKLAKWEVTISPKPGALVFWQSYKNGVGQSTGHMGIFIHSDNGSFYTIEGNTNAHGGREGFEVANQKRYINYNADNGKRLLGFINPKI